MADQHQNRPKHGGENHTSKSNHCQRVATTGVDKWSNDHIEGKRDRADENEENTHYAGTINLGARLALVAALDFANNPKKNEL